jgi:hypothetical protein
LAQKGQADKDKIASEESKSTALMRDTFAARYDQLTRDYRTAAAPLLAAGVTFELVNAEIEPDKYLKRGGLTHQSAS